MPPICDDSESCVIKINKVSKSYGDQVVLRDLSLEVKKGEIYGFLGPNGCGKSTTIMILTGIERSSSGNYEIFGQPGRINSNGLWRRIGVIPEKQYFYENMTAYEYLSFFASLYEMESHKSTLLKWLERVGLEHKRNVRVSHLSNGQRQKLSIIRGLIHDPDLIIFDEPIQGLDPMGVRDIRSLIKDLNKQGKTIFLSSHILSEIEKTADRVGILFNGNLLVEGSMDAIRAGLDQGTVYQIETMNVPDRLVEALRTIGFIKDVQFQNSHLIIKVSGRKDYRGEISKLIVDYGGIILGWIKNEISLEDAFMTITEREISFLADRLKQ